VAIHPPLLARHPQLTQADMPGLAQLWIHVPQPGCTNLIFLSGSPALTNGTNFIVVFYINWQEALFMAPAPPSTASTGCCKRLRVCCT
jgi:hypothetical protein